MLKHCVFVMFRDGVAVEARTQILAGFGQLVDEIDGMIDFSYGPNVDFENKSGAFTDGFIVTFRDRAAHLIYEDHPLHRELGSKLVNLCKGGMRGLLYLTWKKFLRLLRCFLSRKMIDETTLELHGNK